jgi:Bacterial HORMA domain family 1
MSDSLTRTRAATFTSADVAAAVRRMEADLLMIAQSTSAITEDEARDYAYDIELLAQARYLASVDLTLLTGGVNGTEVKAVKYDVNVEAGGLASSRPGGVLWPRVVLPYLRIVLRYTPAYDPAAKQRMRPSLRIGWAPTSADTRHLALSQAGGRNYVSGAYGLQRSDFR